MIPLVISTIWRIYFLLILNCPGTARAQSRVFSLLAAGTNLIALGPASFTDHIEEHLLDLGDAFHLSARLPYVPCPVVSLLRTISVKMANTEEGLDVASSEDCSNKFAVSKAQKSDFIMSWRLRFHVIWGYWPHRPTITSVAPLSDFAYNSRLLHLEVDCSCLIFLYECLQFVEGHDVRCSRSCRSRFR